MLSGEVVDSDEAYEFTWVGKNRDTIENLYIVGNNPKVLKLLQASYPGKVKMIYILIYCKMQALLTS